MKTNIIAFTGISLIVLVALAFASIFEIKLASAQVDATSSPPSSSQATTAIIREASTTTTQAVASTTPALAGTTDALSATNTITSTTSTLDSTNPPATSTAAIEPPPQGLTQVHIIGTKYTDYFSDGKTVMAFPGDPKIDSNFDKPDAPTPTHEGLTWDHTDGGYLYDTPSGDLEVGDYAVQPNNSYIKNAPPFVSSTSTPAQLTTSPVGNTATDTSSTTPSDASPSIPDASASTVPVPSDSSSSTTTSSEPITPTL